MKKLSEILNLIFYCVSSIFFYEFACLFDGYNFPIYICSIIFTYMSAFMATFLAMKLSFDLLDAIFKKNNTKYPPVDTPTPNPDKPRFEKMMRDVFADKNK